MHAFCTVNKLNIEKTINFTIVLLQLPYISNSEVDFITISDCQTCLTRN